jgi:MFS family permease
MDTHEGHKTRTLWLCGALHAFTHVYHVALLPLYLRIQQDLNLGSVEQATLLVTVLGLAYFVPSYPLGALADRVSRKKLLVVGLAINGLGFVLLSFAPNYAWALVGVIVAGFGGSFYHPAATALVTRLFPDRKGRALGLVGIGASVGFFVSPIYTGWRAVVTGSWRAPVLELGVLGLIGAAIFAWLAEEEPARKVRSNPGGREEKIFAKPTLWLFFLAACFAFSLRDFAGVGMSSLCSLFLQQARGFDPKFTGLALSGIFLASAVSNPLFGRLSDRGRIRWVSLVLVLAAAMVVLIPRVSGPWMMVTLLAYGFFFMASYPMVEAAVMESVHDSVRGRVFGLFITVGGLLGNVSHWAVGHWVERLRGQAAAPASYYPLYGLLALLVLLSLAGLPCLHAMGRREHAEKTPDGATPLSALH